MRKLVFEIKETSKKMSIQAEIEYITIKSLNVINIKPLSIIDKALDVLKVDFENKYKKLKFSDIHLEIEFKIVGAYGFTPG